jgi:site-specific DNA recombinase
MKRAAIYARTSTVKQKEEKTSESQIAEVREAIAKDGNVLLEEHVYIDDGYTGELLERPDLDRMRDAAKEHEFDVLYAYDRGRLSRKFIYQGIILQELEDLGIEFI